MIHLLGKIPDDGCVLAVSGGPDSMALADFVLRGGKRHSIAFIHHGTEASDKGHEIVSDWCMQHNIPFFFNRIEGDIPKLRSKEEFWREERYKILCSFNKTILTAHHLDDVVETWIFTSLNGNPFIIPYKNHKKNVIRPFLLNEKKTLLEWNKERNVPFIEDESNYNLKFARNRIRHKIVPEALKINPGLRKVLKKKILTSYEMTVGFNEK